MIASERVKLSLLEEEDEGLDVLNTDQQFRTDEHAKAWGLWLCIEKSHAGYAGYAVRPTCVKLHRCQYMLQVQRGALRQRVR